MRIRKWMLGLGLGFLSYGSRFMARISWLKVKDRVRIRIPVRVRVLRLGFKVQVRIWAQVNGQE